MNKTIFMGRLTRDPIYKEATNGGTSSSRFTLAVDDNWKSKKGDDVDPDWIPMVVFGAKADALAKYCKKGTKILVTGRLKTGKYQDKTSNEWIYTWNIVVDEWEFAESKSNSSTKGTPPESNQYKPDPQLEQPPATPKQENKPAAQKTNIGNQSTVDDEVPEGFFTDFEDLDLPFN